MDHNYEEQTISLAEIWQKLWKNKILILIISIVVTLILTFGLYFGLKGSQMTTTGFEYQFIGVSSNEYPDGTTFEFRDIISYDQLLLVQESNDLYANIDIEHLYLNSSTTIVRQLADTSTSTDIVYTTNQYTLNIPFSYFNYDETLARDFITDLLNVDITEATSKNELRQIYNYVDLVNDNVEYLDAMTYYKDQYNLLINSMNSFISSYQDVTINGLSMTDIKNELTSIYDNGYSFAEIETLIKNEHYYKDKTSYIDKLNIRIATLQKSIDLNVLRINELETMYNNLVATSNLQQADALLQSIADYRIANVNSQFEIDEYQEIIDTASSLATTSHTSADFLAIISDYETMLNDYTDTYNTFYLQTLNDNTKVVYDAGSIYTVSGGYSLPLIGVISLMVGVLSSFVVVFIKESDASKKTND